MKKITNWYYYPKSDEIPDHLKKIVRIFKIKEKYIKSPENKLKSDEVLSVIREDLEAMDFRVEKDKKNKIEIPILFGINGKIEKRFEVDGYNKNTQTIIEIEAGAGVANNHFLKDLFKACLIKEVKYFIIGVRNEYRGSKNFKKVANFYDAIYISDRLKLPLKGILLIGY